MRISRGCRERSISKQDQPEHTQLSLLQSLRDDPLTNDEELAIPLEQAIADHEEILETLCAAREAVDAETPE